MSTASTPRGRQCGLLAAPTTGASVLAVPLGGYPRLFGVPALIAGLAALGTFGTRPRPSPVKP